MRAGRRPHSRFFRSRPFAAPPAGRGRRRRSGAKAVRQACSARRDARSPPRPTGHPTERRSRAPHAARNSSTASAFAPRPLDRRTLTGFFSRNDHVWFEHHAFERNALFVKLLERLLENEFGDLIAAIHVM